MSEATELYIEPTSRCNLNCVMCSRNDWSDKQLGDMTAELFERTIIQIPDTVKRIVFGGIGEPLFHPDIAAMVARAKATECTVEVISNGSLLDESMSRALVEAGLDRLWISLDALDSKRYGQIRCGADYATIMDNIDAFNTARGFAYRHIAVFPKITPKLGIAFVLMKQNLDQLNVLLKSAYALGVNDIKVTHLIPYEQSQVEHTLFDRILGVRLYDALPGVGVNVDLPLLDTRDIDDELLQTFSDPVLSFSIMGATLQLQANHCRFIEDGIMFVRWDGQVAPCLALLHENTVYQRGRERHIKPHSFGAVARRSLTEIWDSEEYRGFRQKVSEFDFSPCVRCGSCELFSSNERDCQNNTFPTCGACLWARGLFQCP